MSKAIIDRDRRKGMQESPPKVFVSYSHDSPGHKRWVAKLAAILRDNGIDITLDQWDCGYGDDLALFMEKGLRESTRVLVICTDEYNRKADAGLGGVGYEKMIVTADLVKDISTNKFIPIIRQVTSHDKTPLCLSTRHYVDLTGFDEKDLKFGNPKIDELLRELHNVPNETKPPIGKNPFAILPSGMEAKPIDVRIQVGGRPQSAVDIYHLASTLARSGDVLGWRQLVKEVKQPVVRSLISWREKYEAKSPADVRALHSAVDEAVEIISSLIIIAIVGVASGRKELKDQRSLFDLIFDIVGWNYSGRTVLIHLPRALGYVYHSLHGAMSVDTGQYDVALQLARMNVTDPLHSYTSPLWQEYTLMGYTDALGGNCTLAWQFLVNACQRWKWLTPIFGSEFDYRISLIAYYASLNVFELADYLSRRGDESIDETTLMPDVPLCFINENRDEVRKAMNLIISHGNKPCILWESSGVNKPAMLKAWPQWQKISRNWLWKLYGNPQFRIEGLALPNNDLIQNIGGASQ